MDRAQLAQLYERYGPLVHRRCLALVRSPVDADDALQETFFRVSRYGPPPSGEPTLAWLYRIAANCCFDAAKRRRREGPEPSEKDRERALHTGSPSDGDRRAVVGTILNTFDETTREIGVLHHLDGFTQDEIASRTGYSRKTIGRKLAAFETAFMTWWQRATEGGAV